MRGRPPIYDWNHLLDGRAHRVAFRYDDRAVIHRKLRTLLHAARAHIRRSAVAGVVNVMTPRMHGAPPSEAMLRERPQDGGVVSYLRHVRPGEGIVICLECEALSYSNDPHRRRKQKS